MNVFVDLTEFLASPCRTGIQRVAGELCRYWPKEKPLTPVRLTNDRKLAALPAAALGLIRRYFEASAEDAAALENELRALDASTTAIELHEEDRVLIPEVFYDPNRVAFFRNMSAAQTRQFYFIVFDLLPFTHPQLFAEGLPQETLNGYLQVIRSASNPAFISSATRDCYYRRLLRKQTSMGPVLRLGSDGLGPRPTAPPLRHVTPKFTVLGTLEPRKNHALILDAFEPLWSEIEGLQLVFLGKMGWIDPATAARVTAMLSGFEYYSRASDDFISRQIQESWATIYVSSAEGFGLPPVESLWLGTPVIASAHIPSLESIDAGVHRVQPLDVQHLQKAVRLFTEKSYAARMDEEALALDLPTWDSFARHTAEWITA